MADWFRLDAEFAVHPKVVDLSDAAFRVHVETLGLVARLETDGSVKLGWTKAATEVVDELVAARLWDLKDGEFVIHDWGDYNPSHQDMDARRLAARDAARIRWGKAPGNPDSTAQSKAQPSARNGNGTGQKDPSEEALALASRLKDLLDEQEVPHTGNVKRWAVDIDVLLRKPHVNPVEVKSILEWSQTPDCWHVVRSGESFKKKYPDMLVTWRKKHQREQPQRDPRNDLPPMELQ